MTNYTFELATMNCMNNVIQINIIMNEESDSGIRMDVVTTDHSTSMHGSAHWPILSDCCYASHATSKMASADAEASDTLVIITDNISVKFLPNYDKLADRILNRGLKYYTQGYIHNIKIFNEENHVRVVADCWRSMRKKNT